MPTWLTRLESRLGPPESRWPSLIALFAIGLMYAALPSRLIGSERQFIEYIPLLMVAALAIPLSLTRRGHTGLNSGLAVALLVALTLFILLALGFLVNAALHDLLAPIELLTSAALLWPTNILIFSFWYWRLDAGGPHTRERSGRHENGDFLFAQLTMTPELLERTGQVGWKPAYIDYLFLAFNVSTALSPTDAAVLSRWAKLLMMLQSLISLTIIVLLAARAVNILGR
jgi:hypothetical protein